MMIRGGSVIGIISIVFLIYFFVRIEDIVKQEKGGL
jgi:hypothetical protein